MATVEKPADTPGPDALEREIEVTRERLAGTIDQLLYRASPKTIAKREAASIKGFFVDPVTGVQTGNIVKLVGGVGGVVALFVTVRHFTR